MDTKTFREKIIKELENLDREQVVRFAWLCAMRALPFLGANGNFDFWEKNERQKHLYAVFYALDAAATKSAVADIAYAAYAAATKAATDAKAAYVVAKATAATNVYAYYAYVATESVATVAAINDTDIDADACATGAADAVIRCSINLIAHIFEDLEIIKSGRVEKHFCHTTIYGKVWGNFQKALENEGCGYWGRLYNDVFDKGFELDKEALVRRMSVPNEIREKGAAAVAGYLEELEKGALRLNEARIIILGEKGAGKTCLARRLINPAAEMTTPEESTAGVDITSWKLEEENINIRIWDFAGHTVTHAVHQFFLSERCLYIMVYDGRSEERNRLEYWLDHMKNYGGDSKAYIIVNERDYHRVEIPINQLKEKYPILDMRAFSIRDDNEKLKAFRDEVAEYIKNNPSWNQQLIPANYYKVKDKLEDLFEKGVGERCKEYITKKEFDSIANTSGIDNADKLLLNLHALGVSLWYGKMKEYDTLVLNPEWISHGVYRIINWANEAKKYEITIDDFVKVFKEDAERYPRDKHKFIFELMKHYELAYQTEGKENLIIPHLLKEDRPKELPPFPIGESLMLRYKADQPLPPDTISRFIVRYNQEIKDGLVWRHGVVLDDGNGNIALVREENLTISVSVKGKGKTDYISRLRATLNDIFNSYRSIKPELQYKVERHGQIPDEVNEKYPLWLPGRDILTHTEDNKPYYDTSTRQDIDLKPTVITYNMIINNTIQNLISGQGNQFIDKSTHNTFNFYNCNIELQGNLNELAQLLAEKGKAEEAEELENVAKALKKVEDQSNEEEVKKTGIVNRLKRLVQELGDEESSLGKTVSGIRNGISMVHDIAQGYNDIAQWVALPQVPRVFLKKQVKD